MRADEFELRERDPAFVAVLRGAIDRHGLAARVRLTGPRTGDDLDATYSRANLLVVPSRAETYGMVVTEALARGIPVVASAVGGLVHTLGHDAAGACPGLVVPAEDATALGAALTCWLADPLLRDGLRARAEKRRGMLQGWEVTSRCVVGALERWSGTRG